MNSLRVVAFVLFYLALTTTITMAVNMIELTQEEAMFCVNQSKVDLVTFSKYKPSDEPTNEILCMGKCVMEIKKMIDKDGKFSEEFRKFVPNEDKDKKDKMLACAAKIEKIVTCQDVNSLRKCVYA